MAQPRTPVERMWITRRSSTTRCPDMAVKVSILVYPVAQDGSRLGASNSRPPGDRQTIAALAPGSTRNRQLHQHYP